MTILRPALADSLRALKLSGMLETLDARLAQAQGGDLGYLEFLQILCDDEITRREQVAMGRRLRRARFDTETTLEGFDFSANSKLPAAQIRDLAALRWLQAGESIILYGAVGVGKTHVAQAMGHLAIRAGAEVRFHKPAASWLIWPAATPTAPSTNGWPPTSKPTCSSWTTSRCASSPPARPTTSTN
jgi:DNA replication protein DnaC